MKDKICEIKIYKIYNYSYSINISISIILIYNFIKIIEYNFNDYILMMLSLKFY